MQYSKEKEKNQIAVLHCKALAQAKKEIAADKALIDKRKAQKKWKK